MTRRYQRFGSDFDPAKDKMLWEVCVTGDGGRDIMVRVKSYDNGKPKIALERPSGNTFHKLGRLSLNEAHGVAAVMHTAVEALDKALCESAKHINASHHPAEPYEKDDDDDAEGSEPGAGSNGPTKHRRLAALGKL